MFKKFGILEIVVFIYVLVCNNADSFIVKSLFVTCKVLEPIREWSPLNATFTCKGLSDSIVTDSPGVMIKDFFDANGTLLEGSILDQIEAFDIWRAKTPFMLSGFKQKLQNLKAIKFHDCGLIHLGIEDMKQYGSDLEYASFCWNRIPTLEKDVFLFNPNLQYINLRENPLVFVDSGFFAAMRAMNQIQKVIFDRSGCINHIFSSKGDIEVNMIPQVWEKCDGRREMELIDKAETKNQMEYTNKIIETFTFRNEITVNQNVDEIAKDIGDLRKTLEVIRKNHEKLQQQQQVID